MNLPEDRPVPAPTVELLVRVHAHDRAAEAVLAERLQVELHALAAAHLGSRTRGATLQPTMLVNEAWIRLVDREGAPFENRYYFLAFASKVMRGVLVDAVRARNAKKRGGGQERLSLADVTRTTGLGQLDLLAMDEALQRLTALDPDCAELVQLRFFGGLELREIAAALGVSESTIDRRWRFARAWLQSQLEP